MCRFADITLAVHHARRRSRSTLKVLIVDLDAHQGNGHERDFMHDPNVFILDAYNPHIFPGDEFAKQGHDIAIHYRRGDRGDRFLPELTAAMTKAMTTFQVPCSAQRHLGWWSVVLTWHLVGSRIWSCTTQAQTAWLVTH